MSVDNTFKEFSNKDEQRNKLGGAGGGSGVKSVSYKMEEIAICLHANRMIQ